MKINRSYERTAEFRERQGAFPFAEVALFVRDVAVSVRASLGGWLRGFFGTKKPEGKKPHQLVLFGTVEGLFGSVVAFEYA